MLRRICGLSEAEYLGERNGQYRHVVGEPGGVAVNRRLARARLAFTMRRWIAVAVRRAAVIPDCTGLVAGGPEHLLPELFDAAMVHGHEPHED